MADPWQAFTNRKLHYAQLQLNAWASAGEQNSDSYREAFVFHAALGYQSLIAEIISAYGIVPFELVALQPAINALAAKDRVSSELTQLQNMESTGSWLAMLLAEYKAVVSLPGEAGVSSGKSEGVITLVELNQDTFENPEVAQEVLVSLKDLVGHFRHLIIEY